MFDVACTFVDMVNIVDIVLVPLHTALPKCVVFEFGFAVGVDYSFNTIVAHLPYQIIGVTTMLCIACRHSTAQGTVWL